MTNPIDPSPEDMVKLHEHEEELRQEKVAKALEALDRLRDKVIAPNGKPFRCSCCHDAPAIVEWQPLLPFPEFKLQAYQEEVLMSIVEGLGVPKELYEGDLQINLSRPLSRQPNQERPMKPDIIITDDQFDEPVVQQERLTVAVDSQPAIGKEWKVTVKDEMTTPNKTYYFADPFVGSKDSTLRKTHHFPDPFLGMSREEFASLSSSEIRGVRSNVPVENLQEEAFGIGLDEAEKIWKEMSTNGKWREVAYCGTPKSAASAYVVAQAAKKAGDLPDIPGITYTPSEMGKIELKAIKAWLKENDYLDAHLSGGFACFKRELSMFLAQWRRAINAVKDLPVAGMESINTDLGKLLVGELEKKAKGAADAWFTEQPLPDGYYGIHGFQRADQVQVQGLARQHEQASLDRQAEAQAQMEAAAWQKKLQDVVNKTKDANDMTLDEIRRRVYMQSPLAAAYIQKAREQLDSDEYDKALANLKPAPEATLDSFFTANPLSAPVIIKTGRAVGKSSALAAMAKTAEEMGLSVKTEKAPTKSFPSLFEHVQSLAKKSRKELDKKVKDSIMAIGAPQAISVPFATLPSSNFLSLTAEEELPDLPTVVDGGNNGTGKSGTH